MCPGSLVKDNVFDSAYGGGTLVLSALAAAGMNSTFCGSCFLGINSHGDGTGKLSVERKHLVEEVMHSVPQDAMRLPMSHIQWQDEPFLSPFQVGIPEGQKQYAAEKILKWYARQQVCIPKENVYLFDDKEDNILPFRGTGMNAHQISCRSRDGSLGHGDVGLCGAVASELKEQKGVSVCKIDCAYGDWSPWSACSAPCGESSRHRTRTPSVRQKNGGKECSEVGASMATAACEVPACTTTTTTTTTVTTAEKEAKDDDDDD